MLVRAVLKNSIFVLGSIGAGSLLRGQAPRSKTEAKLVNQFRQGNSASFEELIRLNRPVILRFVARRVPASAVEDVVQDSLLAAWIDYDSFDATRSFKLWLMGIARNKVRDFWRKQGGEAVVLADWSRIDLNSYDEADYDTVEISQCLKMAWSILEPQLREPIELYYGQSLTLPEIAILLDTNLNTIKFRFYRAHALLAEQLDQDVLERLNAPSGATHTKRGRLL